MLRGESKRFIHVLPIVVPPQMIDLLAYAAAAFILCSASTNNVLAFRLLTWPPSSNRSLRVYQPGPEAE